MLRMRIAAVLFVSALVIPEAGMTTSMGSPDHSLPTNGETAGHRMPLASQIASRNARGALRNFEHDNCGKSFFHAGRWWAVLPGDRRGAHGRWSVYGYSDAVSGTGGNGAWTLASGPLGSDRMRADVKWHGATNTLYVLQFGSPSSHAHLYSLRFVSAAGKWRLAQRVNLSQSLASTMWNTSSDLSLGLDQHGNVLVLGIADGGHKERGLHLAYATAPDLSSWAHTVIDGDTRNSGGSNGHTKADLIHFAANGKKQIGIVYGRSGVSGTSWRFAWHGSSRSSSEYRTGWSVENISSGVTVDDHVSVTTDGENIFAAVKDNTNNIWVLKGQPGKWADPVHVVDRGNPSRPIITYDRTSRRIYIVYQEKLTPHGDILMKASNAARPQFDPNGPGTVILTRPKTDIGFVDPQGPSHTVGADTGGHFFVFAKHRRTGDIWSRSIELSGDNGGPS